MRITKFLLLWTIWYAALSPGCQQREPTARPVADYSSDRPDPEATHERDSLAEGDQTADPRALSERQERAIEAVLAAGGTVERDADGFPTLIDLARDRVSADDQTIQAVLEFPALKKLRLAVSQAEPETISALGSLTGLDELLLQDMAISDDEMIRLLAAMPRLRRLTLRRLSGVTNVTVRALADCPRLEVLALIEMNEVTGAGLDRLQSIKRLRALDLRNCGQLGAEDLARLSNLKGLADLKIGGPVVNDELMEFVSRFPSLQSLTIEDAGVTSEGLLRLANARELAERLRSLTIARSFRVTDEALVVLASFPNLESLALRDMMVNGSFLAEFGDADGKPLPLKTLIVTQAFLTDEAVAQLPRAAPDLTRLDLRGNLGITDVAAGAIQRLSSLRDLHLEETGVSEKTLESLQGE
jgi:hypothetical protein